MAITVSLVASEVTLSTTGGNSTFTQTDASTYGSPLRNAVGVYVSVFKVDYQGNRSPLTTTSDASSPTTDSVWTTIFTADGWHQSLYAAIPNYSAGTYNLYDCAYVPSNKTSWISSIASNNNALTGSGGTGWVQLSDPSQIALNAGAINESLNCTTAILNFVLYPLVKQQFGIQTGVAFLEQSTDSKRTKDVLKYHLYALAVDGIRQANSALNYALAEIFARRASLIG
jgi:hypothetical protein